MNDIDINRAWAVAEQIKSRMDTATHWYWIEITRGISVITIKIQEQDGFDIVKFSQLCTSIPDKDMYADAMYEILAIAYPNREISIDISDNARMGCTTVYSASSN
jgi:hypothetical protein